MPLTFWLMKPDAIRCLKAGCPLNFLESSTTLMKGLDTITRKGGGGGQEAVGVKSGAADDSANNILTLDRD